MADELNLEAIERIEAIIDSTMIFRHSAEGKAVCQLLKSLREPNRAAPPAAQLDAGNLPPLPRPAFLGAGIYGYLHADMERYANQVVAPYAERIRLLEREKAEGVHALSLMASWRSKIDAAVPGAPAIETMIDEAIAAHRAQPAQSIDTPEFREALSSALIPTGASMSTEGLEKVVAFIDGRTAGTASEAARLDWIIGNPNANIIFTATGWTIFDIVTGQTFAAKQPSARAAIDEARAAAPSTQEGAK